MFLFHGCPEYTPEQKAFIRREIMEHTGEDCLFLEQFLGHVEHVRVAKEEGETVQTLTALSDEDVEKLARAMAERIHEGR